MTGLDLLLQGGAQFSGDFVTDWAAILCRFAPADLLQTQDAAAIRREILFCVAGVGAGAFEGGAEDVQQIAVGPVVG